MTGQQRSGETEPVPPPPDGTPGLAGYLEKCCDLLITVQDGVVRALSSADPTLAAAARSACLDRPLAECVTAESRDKIRSLLSDGKRDGSASVEVNLVLDETEVPLRVSALQPGPDGLLLVAARDLREIARLQQLLVEADLALERDYAHGRDSEARVRALLRTAPDAVVIVDAERDRILEMNPVAEDLVRRVERRMVSRPVAELFADEHSGEVADGLAEVRKAGRAEWGRLRLRTTGREVAVSASVMSRGRNPQLLLRIARADGRAEAADDPWGGLRCFPEAMVAATDDFEIVDANQAFAAMVGTEDPQDVRGAPLARFLDRDGPTFRALVRVLRQENTIRRHVTTLHGLEGDPASVEVSGGACLDGVRSHVLMLSPAAVEHDRGALRPVGEMAKLVGRVPLRDIVRETTDIIEGICIEAALVLAQDNRASAAGMLGLSRQSLYSKLRRHGLGDLPQEPSEP